MRKRFDSGVYVQITLKNEIKLKKNGEVETSESHCFADSGSVYDFLINHFDHETSSKAESWAELASVGDFYENAYFEIEMQYEDIKPEFYEVIK